MTSVQTGKWRADERLLARSLRQTTDVGTVYNAARERANIKNFLYKAFLI